MDQIAEIRAFNRFYTRLVGALDEHIVQSEFTLAEARVIYEIGARGRTSAAELARFLGLDRAYLSRILQRLIGEELLIVTPDVNDRRSNGLALSHDGDRVFFSLNAGSDASVAELLAPLDAPSRARLTAAMATIRALLDAAQQRSPVVLRPHRIGDFGWMIHRQGLLYNQQFGWNIDFECLIARIYGGYEQLPQPRQLWVAEQDGGIVGSIFVAPSEGIAGSAQLRMLYVEPEARGQGIGSTLVAQAVSFARENGFARMRLWTHTIQEAARRLYAAAGFAVVETMPEDNFGMQMLGEIWELRLR
ncbi:MAG: GNAT family N-acetyltransferase [Devosia sp.]|nr:GNAT family N-acetyltransferase [Devosia sp.]